MHEKAPSDDTPDLSLELSGAQLREMVNRALHHIVEHVDSLPEQPVWNSDGAADLARSIMEELPEKGTAYEPLIDDFFDRLVKTTYNTASPGYFAYIPGGGLLHAAVANFMADTVNRYAGVWIAAPALAQIEACVVRWFCDIIGYPAAAGGFLTTGGSLANWSGLVTARRCRLPDDFLSATVYTSDQTHHSVQKSAMLAGLPLSNVRQVESDTHFRIRTDRLVEMIAADRNDGLTPFAIVGNAGTTNTGAVDDLSALADIAADQHLWLHVDAAYGGFFMLTARGRAIMRGLERADSVTLDPHKGMFLPYGTGCLLVRNQPDLRRAFSLHADYMPTLQDDPDFVDFCEVSPELSRDFRGLRVWLPIKMHGIGVFRQNLDEKLDLTSYALAELRRLADEFDGELEIVAEPQLSVIAFRLHREGWDEEALTKLNEEFRSRINATRRVFLTSTTLRGRYVLRICILSFRTHADRVRTCIAEIRRAMAEIRSPVA